MLQTLLYEVMAHESRLYPQIQETYRRLRAASEGPITWSYSDLKDVFKSITSSSERFLQIFLLVDALDESNRTELLDVLLLLREGSKTSSCVIKIVLASRPNEMISKALSGAFHIIIEDENRRDIELLVDTKLVFLRDETDTSLFEWTSTYLKKHAQGVFLWVSLIAQDLERLAEGGYSEKEIKEMVRTFPIELVDYYKVIIKQLAESESNVVKEARMMLDWTCCTERPLTAMELRDIIAVPSSPECSTGISIQAFEAAKLRRLGDIGKRIRRNCGDLLEIKKQRDALQSPSKVHQSLDIDPHDVVQLLHQTVKEFLVRPDKIAHPFDIDMKSADSTIGLICARYIELSLMIDHAPDDGSTLPPSAQHWTLDHHDQLLEHIEARPLLHYALKYLPYHLRHSPRRESESWGVLDNYFRRAKESAGFAWYLLQEWFENLGFSKTAASSVDAATDFRITSLIIAIKYRRLGAIQVLSEIQRNIDYVDGTTHHTALQTAASCGDLSILKFLISNGASVNFHGGHFGTALQAAAYHGHGEAVEVLIENGADLNAEAGSWSTAFLAASTLR